MGVTYTLKLVIMVISLGAHTELDINTHTSLTDCYVEGNKIVANVTRDIPETDDRKVTFACVRNKKGW